MMPAPCAVPEHIMRPLIIINQYAPNAIHEFSGTAKSAALVRSTLIFRTRTTPSARPSGLDPAQPSPSEECSAFAADRACFTI